MDNEKNEKYAFLSRLQSDCEYFLETAEAMKDIYIMVP